jgi:hypothetical protein
MVAKTALDGRERKGVAGELEADVCYARWMGWAFIGLVGFDFVAEFVFDFIMDCGFGCILDRTLDDTFADTLDCIVDSTIHGVIYCDFNFNFNFDFNFDFNLVPPRLLEPFLECPLPHVLLLLA